MYSTAAARKLPRDVPKDTLITLILTPKSPCTTFSVKPATFRYNKDFAWSFTLDDGLVSAWLVAFPYFNGGSVAPSYIDQWGHDQGGDGRIYPGLFYTDGCGHRIPFQAALAINAGSIADEHNSLHHPGNLSWQQIATLYRTGWDIFNHGYAHATGRNVNADVEIRKNNEAVEKHLGLQMSQFVIPGGKDDKISQEPYVQAALRQGMSAVHCGNFPQHWILPDSADRKRLLQDTSWPYHLLAGRQFISSKMLRENGDAVFLKELSGLLQSDKKIWVNAFTHSTGNEDLWGISLKFDDFRRFFDTLAALYGESGQDNMWMASFQAVQEYLEICHSLQYEVKEDHGRIILRFDPAQLPQGLRHKALSFVWQADQPLKKVQCRGCTVESFSRKGSPQVINISW